MHLSDLEFEHRECDGEQHEGAISPVIRRSRVVLPAPLTPMMPRRSPSFTEKDTSERIGVSPKESESPVALNTIIASS